MLKIDIKNGLLVMWTHMGVDPSVFWVVQIVLYRILRGAQGCLAVPFVMSKMKRTIVVHAANLSQIFVGQGSSTKI